MIIRCFTILSYTICHIGIEDDTSGIRCDHSYIAQKCCLLGYDGKEVSIRTCSWHEGRDCLIWEMLRFDDVMHTRKLITGGFCVSVIQFNWSSVLF